MRENDWHKRGNIDKKFKFWNNNNNKNNNFFFFNYFLKKTTKGSGSLGPSMFFST